MSAITVESVWDYPRPPRLEPSPRHVRIVHAGRTLAESDRTWRILETSHPPVYYIPQADIAMERLTPSTRRNSVCEWKGAATYWNLDVHGISPDAHAVSDVAWSYARPVPTYAALADHLAFYASRVEECTVDGEVVHAQPGDLYGGWITSHVRGPFKGAAGTLGW